MDRKDRSDYLSGDENSRGRGDMGDAGGARVGGPTAAPREASEGERGASKGPSSQPVKEGLEGAIFEGSQAGSSGAKGGGQSLGAGSEASRGTHEKQGQDASTGSCGAEGGSPRGGSDRLGSEPLGRDREHLSGYGVKGGAPKTSSDKREPTKD